MRGCWAILPILLTTLSGCVALERFTGSALTDHSRVLLRTRTAEAEMREEQAHLMKLYRLCLERREQDPALDYSEYRSAVRTSVEAR